MATENPPAASCSADDSRLIFVMSFINQIDDMML